MEIILYLNRSDTCAQMEHILEGFELPYVLHYKEEDPEIQPWLGLPHSPVLAVNGSCTFFSPHISAEEFEALIRSCLIAEDIKRNKGPTAD